ncbi:hypothetical protein RJ641_001476 [Dillenia turbinata]|uniref:Uncharacterized protein n=1 Tax=Dillenia turbinata TaxID=194707 RepID=A0AAN8ZV52_9MAGN
MKTQPRRLGRQSPYGGAATSQRHVERRVVDRNGTGASGGDDCCLGLLEEPPNCLTVRPMPQFSSQLENPSRTCARIRNLRPLPSTMKYRRRRRISSSGDREKGMDERGGVVEEEEEEEVVKRRILGEMKLMNWVGDGPPQIDQLQLHHRLILNHQKA